MPFKNEDGSYSFGIEYWFKSYPFKSKSCRATNEGAESMNLPTWPPASPQ